LINYDTLFVSLLTRETNVQIPLDGHGPNQTGPDPTRNSVRVSGLRPGLRHVWFSLDSTTRARPDFVVEFPRKTRLEKPNLCKDGRRQRNCCSLGSLIKLSCSLGAASLLLKKKRQHSAWVKKYIREREQYGECNTLLPELAATEVVKCVQYMRMDIEVFEEFL